MPHHLLPLCVCCCSPSTVVSNLPTLLGSRGIRLLAREGRTALYHTPQEAAVSLSLTGRHIIGTECVNLEEETTTVDAKNAQGYGA